MKEVDSVIIAKIDITANDIYFEKNHSQLDVISKKINNFINIIIYQINMYPTLRLYRANNKENPIQYNEKDKSLQSLFLFLKENVGYNFFS